VVGFADAWLSISPRSVSAASSGICLRTGGDWSGLFAPGA
jgi:hypothetical protein